MPKLDAHHANGFDLGASAGISAPKKRPGNNQFLIVGIGASTNGLDACEKLLDTLPVGDAMSFLVVQHLDPFQDTMLVDLLIPHTSMPVQQAMDGMLLEPGNIYVIPPGAYLSVGNGVLHLSQLPATSRARLPCDFLLHSLAEHYGSRVIAVILSGSGADGSRGLRAVKAKGGFVIAQDPKEAGSAGMPHSAILTGVVDLVLPVAEIAGAIADRGQRLAESANVPEAQDIARDCVFDIVDLLRVETTHDFTHYKRGTLERRIHRRMSMSSINSDSMDAYLELLRGNAEERDLLTRDLLINVTGFFRDPEVFEFVAQRIIPDLIGGPPSNRPLRIWIAGCSTGEEVYSLLILFREAIAVANSSVKLQVFASDVDAEALAVARQGVYSDAIIADISPDRLSRFFLKKDDGYHVLPELRSTVVFTVHNILTDPPFSHLDMISCRNLLIYLDPAAQNKAVSQFEFALNANGVVLLGNSETIAKADGGFELIPGPARLWRNKRSVRAKEPDLAVAIAGRRQFASQFAGGKTQASQSALGDLCRRLITETYTPASVLINSDYECLHYLGPTDAYLQVAPGRPVHNLLEMARNGLRMKLRSAIELARLQNSRIVVAGGRIIRNNETRSISIAVQPVAYQGANLLLICFIDEPRDEIGRDVSQTAADIAQIAELGQELEATRTELRNAMRDLESSVEEQNEIVEEALSAKEEYQSTNEELQTSKEELQSLNEELSVLNDQLQQTLARQRTTSNDLQNILHSTDVATIFLDAKLNIRYFTPSAKSFFHVIPGDIGRPLGDLNSLTSDNLLLTDAETVMNTLALTEREVQSENGSWHIRRILPYRTQENEVEGVVITFVDITERRRVADTLDAAKRQAQFATVTKSRFLAAASHDLRQPLQTLALLQGQLAKLVEGEQAQKVVSRLDEIQRGMLNILDSLLDINQIETGAVRAEMVLFPINDVLYRLNEEFIPHAHEQNITLRMVPCGLYVLSDVRLLEQMLRNLLSNALKYTKRGKVLFGCRRVGGNLSIEVLDTGAGIPEDASQTIFDEYKQLDNALRERGRGHGLGLSIVQQLGKLLGHGVRVRSQPGKGSVFSIDVALLVRAVVQSGSHPRSTSDATVAGVCRTGAILIVEDDPEVLNLLEHLLKEEGHYTAIAADGPAAVELVSLGIIRPDLILADYNLPGGMDGVEMVANLREHLQRHIPAIVLTGDISSVARRKIAHLECKQLNKPIKMKELTQSIQHLLPLSQSATLGRASVSPAARRGAETPVVFVIDDDDGLREELCAVIEDGGHTVEAYATGEAFMDAQRSNGKGCLLVDAHMPGMSGLELLRRLNNADSRLPAIVITGHGDIAMAVQAMKAGALDFIEKPVGHTELLASIAHALDHSNSAGELFERRANAANKIGGLTLRERQIMDLVLAGHPSKNIAADLHISQRTVETHRAAIMRKTDSKSLPALARFALAAGWGGANNVPSRKRSSSSKK